MSRKLLLLVVCSALLSAGCAAPTASTASTPSAAIPATQPIGTSEIIPPTSEPVAAPAAFNTPPVPTRAATQSTALAPINDIADAFDSGLQRVITGDATSDPAIASLPPDEGELLSTVLDSLSLFRTA